MHVLIYFALTVAPSFSIPTCPQGDVENSIAPGTQDVVWLDGGPAGTQRRFESSGTGVSSMDLTVPTTGGLDAWFGRPVVLVQVPAASGAEWIELLELLARANADRDLIVATIHRAPAPVSGGAKADDDLLDDDPLGGDESSRLDRAELEARFRHHQGLSEADKLDIPRPSQRLAAGYVDPESKWLPNDKLTATIVGPSGEWMGRVLFLEDEDRFFELLEAALSRFAADPLQEDLPKDFSEIQSLYFAGSWHEARSDAAKTAKRLAKKDPILSEAATAFVAHVNRFERELHTRLIVANGAIGNAWEMARIGHAVQRGFPKGQSVELFETILSKRRKSMSGGVALLASIAFAEELEKRPVLFPEIADRQAKSHAKALGEIRARARSYSGPITQRIEALVARFESAPKKRR